MPDLSALYGDPLGLAAWQFRLAQELCGVCGDYHALWPYRRLAGLAKGVEECAPLVAPMLRKTASAGGAILIPGVADAGSFAMVAGATKGSGVSITVADRCATPLAVCRRYAGAHGFDVAAVALDFGSTPVPGRYDVILLHCFLQFMAPVQRTPFLRALRASLKPSGTLIAVERRVVHGGAQQASYATRMIDALLAHDVPLPEERGRFHARIAALMETRDRRLASFPPEEFQSVLQQAGFSVARWLRTREMQMSHLADGEQCVYEVAVAAPAAAS